MWFYCYDAHDLSSCFSPGTVVLFGMLSNGERACVRVLHVPRIAFVLMNEGYAPEVCREELLQVLGSKRWQVWSTAEVRSRQVQIDGPYQRKYCFEHDPVHLSSHMKSLPNGRAACLLNRYMRIQYPATCAQINASQIPCGQSYKQLLTPAGTPLQRVLIECGLHGPGWIKLLHPRAIQQETERWSTLQHEYELPTFHQISTTVPDAITAEEAGPQHTPTFRVASVVLQWSLTQPSTLEAFAVQHYGWSPEQTGLDIQPTIALASDVAASCDTYSAHMEGTLTLAATDSGVAVTTTDQLLDMLYQNAIQPADVIMGYGWHDADLQRLIRVSGTRWPELGRLKHTALLASSGSSSSTTGSTSTFSPYRSWRDSANLVAGRLYADVLKLALEYTRPRPHRFTLEAYAHMHLHSNDQVWATAPYSLRRLQIECVVQWELMRRDTILDLTFELSRVAGCCWSHTFTMERSILNDWLLLHEFHQRDFLLPPMHQPSTFSRTMSAPSPVSVSTQKRGSMAFDSDNDDDDDEAQELLDQDDYESTETEVEPELPARSSSSVVSRNHAQKRKHPGSGPLLLGRADAKSFVPSTSLALKTGKGKYEGGLVLEPRVGMHQNVAVLDVKSSYPSCMVSNNICFSTLQYWQPELPVQRERIMGKNQRKERGESDGVISAVEKRLMDQREVIQKHLKTGSVPTGSRTSMNARQTALKLLANCMYGCFGFDTAQSYFAQRSIATLITACGRSILSQAQATIMEYGKRYQVEVIYGDTDSLMISIPGANSLAQVERVSNTLLTHVNDALNGVQMKPDALFESLMMVCKKKYAALAVSRLPTSGSRYVIVEMVIKGLDMVRTDWCPLSAELCEELVRLLLSHSSFLTEARTQRFVLDQVYNMIKLFELRCDACLSLDKFVITKFLSKPVDQYEGILPLHVQAARTLQQLGHTVTLSTAISYVVTTPVHERLTPEAYNLFPYSAPFYPRVLPFEIARHSVSEVHVDSEYYVRKQLIPPVERLLKAVGLAHDKQSWFQVSPAQPSVAISS